MSWVKLDDKFHAHPKIAGIPLAAVGLFVKSLSYCGDFLTDGFVPQNWAHSQPTGHDPQGVISDMVDFGLWEPVEGGYQIRDYLDYNPSKEQVLLEREELSAMRSRAGKKGAAKRWEKQANGKQDGKDITSQGQAYDPVPAPPPVPTPVSSSNVSVLRKAKSIVEFDSPDHVAEASG